MARKKYNRVILEYQLHIPASQLKKTLNNLSADNNTVSDTITIHDIFNTKVMDNINYTATLNQDNTITLNLNWSDNNIPYKQTLTMVTCKAVLVYSTRYQYYFFINGKRKKNVYYNEHQFKSDEQFECRLENRYISKKTRALQIIMNPPVFTGDNHKQFIKDYERYQIKLNEYFMDMVTHASSKEKEQLDKFIKWSEQIKESINKMQ